MTRSLLDEGRGTVAGIVWPPIVDGPAATLLALALQLERSQWFEPEALRAKQLGQLGRLAPWLAAHSPAFARRLAAANLAPDALASADGFAALPVVDRRWYQDNADLYSDAVPPAHEPLGTNTTSGSTGEFIRIRRTRINQLIWLAMVLRDHVWRGTDFAAPLATCRAPSSGIKHHPDWGPPATLFFDTGPALALPVSLPGDEMFDRLDAFGVGNLMIYPNALRTLIDTAEARGERLKTLRAIRTIGEIVDDSLRERARTILGAEISDAYTCQEAGYLALQCPDSGLYHLMADALIVEVLRPDGTPSAEGEIGRVVITDPLNFATPVVRYALGDMAEVAGPCPCGRGLPTIRRIVGRSRNLIRLPDGTRVWPQLGGLGQEGYLQTLPIMRFQIIQTGLDTLELRFVTRRPLTAEEEQLVTEKTHRSLGHPFKLEFRYFEDQLPLSASEKFEDFICLV